MPIINHWVGGAEFEGTSDRLADVFNPALGVATKQVRLASTGDLDSAVAVAKKAFESWSTMSMTKRVAILFSFRELLEARKHELAEIITSEHGKVLSDALGEITRGQEVVEFACGLPHMLKGEYSLNASTNVDVYSLLQPLGVVGIVSPFNFPAMVPMWFFPVAIAAGNTVILKPSEKDPSASMWVANLWKEAGRPDGVFNVVHGDKVSVDGLLEHPDVESLSFVGSTPIAQYVYEKGAANGKRVQALGGAKNHMLVLPDANLDLAADSAVNAGFGSAGERCMAISVVVAVDPIGDELVNAISEKMSKIVVGDGTRSCDMGPLVTQVHRDKVASYLDIATQDGATIVQDGRGVTPDGDENGFWLGPTLIDNVPTTSKVYQEEIFGPVLSVITFRTPAEAVTKANNTEYGLSAGIWTEKGSKMLKLADQLNAGVIWSNTFNQFDPTSPFGGFKESGYGREGGRQGLLSYLKAGK